MRIRDEYDKYDRMDKKLEMMLDSDEMENLDELTTDYPIDSTLVSCGSMAVAWNDDIKKYEVYLFRGYYKGKPPKKIKRVKTNIGMQ